MRGLSIILFAGLLFIAGTADISAQELDYTQETDTFRKKRQIGFNMTSLMSSLIPFREGITASGPFGITWRAGSGRRFFNFQMGASIRSDFDIDVSFLNLQLGYGTRKPINDRFSYFNTYNLILSGGGFNLPGEQFNDNGATFGISFGGGLEYQLYKGISIAVETLFVIGSDEFGPQFRIIPPIGLFMLAKF